MSVHFSSKSDEWETPQWLFDELNKEFNFEKDVCANEGNYKVDLFFTKKEDGLQLWWGNLVCWCNPPYSQLKKWVAKCAQSAKEGATVVMLIPARTDTIAFHEYIWDNMNHKPRPGVEVRFLKGRLKFGGAKHGAPFPSAIVIFRPQC